MATKYIVLMKPAFQRDGEYGASLYYVRLLLGRLTDLQIHLVKKLEFI